ncbi:MAG TPA: hypothetical protein VJB60_01210 [Candidatus Peribacterales bacterium]|nr:hypothetical protein [Candidatus Peribacterales bacterium]
MKKPIAFTGVALLLMGVFSTLFLFANRSTNLFGEAEEGTPELKTEQLTSYFLLRNIDRLRDQAVYIQHQEEGKKLLTLGGVDDEEEGEESESNE